MYATQQHRIFQVVLEDHELAVVETAAEVLGIGVSAAVELIFEDGIQAAIDSAEYA